MLIFNSYLYFFPVLFFLLLLFPFRYPVQFHTEPEELGNEVRQFGSGEYAGQDWDSCGESQAYVPLLSNHRPAGRLPQHAGIPCGNLRVTGLKGGSLFMITELCRAKGGVIVSSFSNIGKACRYCRSERSRKASAYSSPAEYIRDRLPQESLSPQKL